MNATFTNWNPAWNSMWNQSWNPGNSFTGSVFPCWNGFDHTPNTQPGFFGQTPNHTPQGFWNQNIAWNQNAWPTPTPQQSNSGYGYGPNGWWFGNPTPFNTPSFSNNGFNQPGNWYSPTFNNGFNPGYEQSFGATPNFHAWNSATSPWFANNAQFARPQFFNTPWNNTTNFAQNTPFGNSTLFGFTPLFNTGWQPFANWFHTPNTFNAHNAFTPSFGFANQFNGTTPWNPTGFGWNTNTPTNLPNFAPTNYAPTGTSWNQSTPSYTGTPDHFTSNGTPAGYPQTPANCNGRDAA